ncbi:hypothetical protein D918_02000 [Trichuris suis]|nr:hypothetical protein D918_02000 [Trichuris suis]
MPMRSEESTKLMDGNRHCEELNRIQNSKYGHAKGEQTSNTGLQPVPTNNNRGASPVQWANAYVHRVREEESAEIVRTIRKIT